MTKSRFLGAAAILAAVIAAPATAQRAIQEPGAYAHIYNYRHGHPGYWPSDVVVVPVPFQDSDADAYLLRRPTDDDYYATYYGDRPVTRMTSCGLQSGAMYLGPDGRWYPC
jgi:hypothetical protein